MKNSKESKNRSKLINKDNFIDIFYNVTDAIFFLDADWNFEMINKKTALLFGFTEDEMIGKNFSTFIHPDGQNDLRRHKKHLIENGKYENYETRIITKSGKKKDIRANSTAIFKDKKIIGSMVITRDITINKLLEIQIDTYNEILVDTKELLEEEVKKKTREIWLVLEGFVETIAALSEYKEDSTCQHITRIKAYAQILAEEMKRDSIYSEYINKHESYIKDIMFASILHDIGKTAIPDEILQKPARLDERERAKMIRHTVIAGDIIEKYAEKLYQVLGYHSYLSLAKDIIYSHHERWDGKGYPEGKKCDEIPLSARIIAVCDVYDALTSDRPYKLKWPHEKAIDYIISEKGKHFDPYIVDAFENIVDEFKKINLELHDKTA